MNIDVTKPELYQARNGAKCIGIVKDEDNVDFPYLALYKLKNTDVATVNLTEEGYKYSQFYKKDWDLILIPQVTLVFEDWLTEQGVSTYKFYKLVKKSGLHTWKEYKLFAKEDYVGDGFDWSETKEGYYYWADIFTSWLTKLASHNGPVVLGFDKKPNKGK